MTEIDLQQTDEEKTSDGLGVLIRKRRVFHGSGTSEINQFNKAENETVGSGVYLTSEAKDAAGYAYRRSRGKENSVPTVYEITLENVRLLDLRDDDNVRKVLRGFLEMVKKELAQPGLSWNYEAVLLNAVQAINQNKTNSGESS